MNELVATLTGFARTLRAAGVPADHERTQGMLAALDHLDPVARDDVYWAGRLTMCAGPDDLPRYDRCFEAYFSGWRATPRPRPTVTVTRFTLAERDEGEQGQDQEGEGVPATASTLELLRNRDVATLTTAEREEVNRLIALLATGRAQRRSRRYGPAHRGVLDPRRTVRETIRRGGEPGRLKFKTRRDKPRRVVLLVDISGSMSSYADSLLRFAHALVRTEPSATEVFSTGTRLTRVTTELRHRDPGVAMAAVSAAIPDWSGGTRLGEELREFLRGHHARGAVVVIASDGWERGSPELLGRQMERLSRLAHHVIWVNPHKGHPEYEPLTGGMRAALPYVDDLVAGHSLAAFEELAGRLSHA